MISPKFTVVFDRFGKIDATLKFLYLNNPLILLRNHGESHGRYDRSFGAWR
jgi:hypothetical protein